MEIGSANYWKPNGNAFVGDCMAFCKDGIFHVYYLFDIGHHNHPTVGDMGGHQWYHLTSTDLIHWSQHGAALPLDFEAGETSNCTGSVLAWQGKVYAFYALRSRFFGGEHFRIAVSEDDGYTFPKRITPDLPTPPSAHGAFRDPHAFIGEDGQIHILIASGASADDPANPFVSGEVAHYVTSDMEHFTKLPPLMHAYSVPECCDYFKMGKYYYHTCNYHWQTYIRMSEKPFGPWTVPQQEVPASRFCAVMKTAEWTGGRRIGVGWIPACVNGAHQFGGYMTFREIVQNPDGSLGTKFVSEMLPQNAPRTFEDMTLDSKDECTVMKTLARASGNFLLEGTIAFQPGTFEFGVIAAWDEPGYWKKAAFDPLAATASLSPFDLITRVPMDPAGVPFKLVRHGDILDLEINGNRTIVAASFDHPGNIFLSLFVRNGKTAFKDLKLICGGI